MDLPYSEFGTVHCRFQGYQGEGEATARQWVRRLAGLCLYTGDTVIRVMFLLPLAAQGLKNTM